MQYLASKTFQHEDAIEYYFMNVIDNYDIHIRDYCRMTLYLVGSALKIKIPLQVEQEDIDDLLDPLFNRDKIGD